MKCPTNKIAWGASDEIIAAMSASQRCLCKLQQKCSDIMERFAKVHSSMLSLLGRLLSLLQCNLSPVLGVDGGWC